MATSTFDFIVRDAASTAAGGGGDGTPIVVSSDNSVRSNISNVVSTSTVVTSNDSFTNAIVSSV